MKTIYLLRWYMVIVGTAGLAGLDPAECRLRLRTVFAGGDERIWRLMIETEQGSSYRVVCEGGGGSAEVMGTTTAGRKGYEGAVWIVLSQVNPAGTESGYLKAVLKNSDMTVTQTREVARGQSLDSLLTDVVPEKWQSYPLGSEVTVLKVGGGEIRICVGEGPKAGAAVEPGSVPGTYESGGTKGTLSADGPYCAGARGKAGEVIAEVDQCSWDTGGEEFRLGGRTGEEWFGHGCLGADAWSSNRLPWMPELDSLATCYVGWLGASFGNAEE